MGRPHRLCLQHAGAGRRWCGLVFAALVAVTSIGCEESADLDVAPDVVGVEELGLPPDVTRALSEAVMQRYLVFDLTVPGDWRTARSSIVEGAVIIDDPTVDAELAPAPFVTSDGTGLRSQYVAGDRRSMLLETEDHVVVGTITGQGGVWAEQIDLTGNRVADVVNVITEDRQRFMVVDEAIWALDEAIAGLGLLCSANALGIGSGVEFESPQPETSVSNLCPLELDQEGAAVVAGGAPSAAGLAKGVGAVCEAEGYQSGTDRRGQVTDGFQNDLNRVGEAYQDAIDVAELEMAAEIAEGSALIAEAYADRFYEALSDLVSSGGASLFGLAGANATELLDGPRETAVVMRAEANYERKVREAARAYEEGLDEIEEKARRGDYDEPTTGEGATEDDDRDSTTSPVFPGEGLDPDAAMDRLCRYRQPHPPQTIDEYLESVGAVVDNRCDEPVTADVTDDPAVLCNQEGRDQPTLADFTTGYEQGCNITSAGEQFEGRHCEPSQLTGIGDDTKLAIRFMDLLIVAPCPDESCDPLPNGASQ